MEPIQSVSFVIAFSAGFLSFISPCVLPLIPSFLAFITGLSLDELTQGGQKREVRWLTISHSLSFILGFSTVFILFGASASVAGQLLIINQELFRRVGGILIIFFGLYIMGVFRIPFLMSEKRMHLQKKPAGYIGTYLVGVTFAVAWTPCVGPILGSILVMASTYDAVFQGVLLLSVYSLGLGIPLFLTAVGFNTFLSRTRKMRASFRWISMISGLFLILVGAMIFSNSFTIFTALLSQLGIGWYVGQ